MIYEVGNSGANTISALPWPLIGAGDTVRIHARPEPYRELMFIGNSGRPGAPIIVEGVADTFGKLPVISADRAVMSKAQDWWNADRGLIRVSGSSIPANKFVTDLTIRNLRLADARFGGQCLREDGTLNFRYIENMAAIQVEKGERILFDNVEVDNSGCGFFIGTAHGFPPSRDITFRNCRQTNMGYSGNGQVHGNYTEAVNVIYDGCYIGMVSDGGAAVKSRDAGLTVTRSTIDGGNYCIDCVNTNLGKALVDADPSFTWTNRIEDNIILKRNRSQQEAVFHFGRDTPDGLAQGLTRFKRNTVVLLHRGQALLFLINDPRTIVECEDSYFFKPGLKKVVGRQDWDNEDSLPYYGVKGVFGSSGKLVMRNCVLPEGAKAGESWSNICFFWDDKAYRRTTVDGKEVRIPDAVELVKENCRHRNAFEPERLIDYVLETDLGQRQGPWFSGTDVVKKIDGTWSSLTNELAGIGANRIYSFPTPSATPLPTTPPPTPEPPPAPEPTTPPPTPPPPPASEPSIDNKLKSLQADRLRIVALRDELTKATVAYEKALDEVRKRISNLNLP